MYKRPNQAHKAGHPAAKQGLIPSFAGKNKKKTSYGPASVLGGCLHSLEWFGFSYLKLFKAICMCISNVLLDRAMIEEIRKMLGQPTLA